jgi:osmotically-inducible protein OsmY
VKDINGIEGVKNEMTVAKASKKADRSIKEKIDDASITAQVKMALMSHRSTSVRGTKVATKDGIVTLTGIAKNGSEKDLVTKFVGDIHGVNSVVNKMMI